MENDKSGNEKENDYADKEVVAIADSNQMDGDDYMNEIKDDKDKHEEVEGDDYTEKGNKEKDGSKEIKGDNENNINR